MARRKAHVPQVVWTASRYQTIGEWSKAEVTVRVFTIGTSGQYEYTALFRLCAQNGEVFDSNVTGYTSLSTYNLDEASDQIATLREFLGSGEINADKTRAAMLKYSQGFYDRRLNTWQAADKRDLEVFEPGLSWYDDDKDLEDVDHLHKVYAKTREEAETIVAEALVKAGRLDILRDWSRSGMQIWDVGRYGEEDDTVNLEELFAPSPHNVIPELPVLVEVVVEEPAT